MSDKLQLTDPTRFSPTGIVKLLTTALHLQFGNCCSHLAANFPVGAETQIAKFLSVA